MAKWVLKFASWREKNDIFQAVKDGKKEIETRPATVRYLKIREGDMLSLLSLDSGEKIVKKVTFVHKYKTVEEMAEKEPVEKIIPGIKTAKELVSIFEEFKKKWRKFEDNIKNYGILAVGME